MAVPSFQVQAGLLLLSAPDVGGSNILPSAAIYLPVQIAYYSRRTGNFRTMKWELPSLIVATWYYGAYFSSGSDTQMIGSVTFDA